MDHMNRRERAITQILFDILTELKQRDEYAAADAIWQSVWNPSWLRASISHKLVQSVRQFPRNIKVENRRAMFELTCVDILTFHPEWLIERILNHGNIRLACLVRTSEQDRYVDYTIGEDKKPKSAMPQLNDLFDKMYKDFGKEGAQAEANETRLEQSPTSGKDDVKAAPSLKELPSFAPLTGGNISMMNLTGGLVQQIVEIFTSTLAVYPTSGGPTEFRLSSAYTNQLILFGSLFDSGATRSEFLRGQCAVFDVDSLDDERGLILTPFQLPLERIPTPDLRWMSVSHIFERVKGREGLDEYETFRTKRLVRGMWQLMDFPDGRYNLV